MEPKRSSCFAFETICGAHMVKLNDWVFSALENDVNCIMTATKGDSLVSVSFRLLKLQLEQRRWTQTEAQGWKRSKEGVGKMGWSHQASGQTQNNIDKTFCLGKYFNFLSIILWVGLYGSGKWPRGQRTAGNHISSVLPLECLCHSFSHQEKDSFPFYNKTQVPRGL